MYIRLHKVVINSYILNNKDAYNPRCVRYHIDIIEITQQTHLAFFETTLQVRQIIIILINVTFNH